LCRWPAPYWCRRRGVRRAGRQERDCRLRLPDLSLPLASEVGLLWLLRQRMSVPRLLVAIVNSALLGAWSTAVVSRLQLGTRRRNAPDRQPCGVRGTRTSEAFVPASPCRRVPLDAHETDGRRFAQLDGKIPKRFAGGIGKAVLGPCPRIYPRAGMTIAANKATPAARPNLLWVNLRPRHVRGWGFCK
jgi:hypothetical protein